MLVEQRVNNLFFIFWSRYVFVEGGPFVIEYTSFLSLIYKVILNIVRLIPTTHTSTQMFLKQSQIYSISIASTHKQLSSLLLEHRSRSEQL